MNFFRHQEEARRNTGRLILLFSLAVIAVILTVNLLFIAGIGFTLGAHRISGIYDGEH